MAPNFSTQNKALLIALVIFATLYFTVKSKNNETETTISNEKKPLYADTLIPKGQVLIPIELANVAAVAGLIDQFGIVDLYSGSETGSVLIATRVKILRAPLNPNQYAVMIAETESPEIMKAKGPFFAVVQNRFAKNETLPAVLSNKMIQQPEKGLSKTPNIEKKIEIEYFKGE